MSQMIKAKQINLTCLRPRNGQFITFLVGVVYSVEELESMAMDAYGCELENLTARMPLPLSGNCSRQRNL